MTRKMWILVMLAGWLVSVPPAAAHFGMVIPSDSMVMQGEKRTITLQLSFSHPFEGVGMRLEKPKAFWVVAHGKREDLLDSLKETRVMEQMAWHGEYAVKRPGVYAFILEPQPYWEPAEDIFIVHYTKTVVAAFGDDEGWDAEIGLKTEIVPLCRPFALYAGNVFQGIVKLNGNPVPHAAVEVEYYNRDGRAKAPSDYMIAQTLKADANGVFSYAVPKAGWWGFAALSEGDFTIKTTTGEEKGVELGAVLWVEFHEWKQ